MNSPLPLNSPEFHSRRALAPGSSCLKLLRAVKREIPIFTEMIMGWILILHKQAKLCSFECNVNLILRVFFFFFFFLSHTLQIIKINPLFLAGLQLFFP